MMNLPKLRGAKFLEDQSIRSAKYELTSELKKMPNFSVLLLLTWCQQHCQIKSKTRVQIHFFFLFVMVGFFGVCLWVNVIFDHLFVGKWGFLQRDIVERTSTQSSTTQCHSLQQRWYQPRVPPAQRTEMQVSWFVKWCCLFCFYQDYKSVIWKDESFYFFVWRERESPSTVKLHVFYFKGTSTTLYTSYSKLHKSTTTFSCHMEPAKKIVWLIWKSFLSCLLLLLHFGHQGDCIMFSVRSSNDGTFCANKFWNVLPAESMIFL